MNIKETFRVFCLVGTLSGVTALACKMIFASTLHLIAKGSQETPICKEVTDEILGIRSMIEEMDDAIMEGRDIYELLRG